jgi:glutaminyl-peptide cyclotransferase
MRILQTVSSVAALAAFLACACNAAEPSAATSPSRPPSHTAQTNKSQAPPASRTGGFDGAKAYLEVQKLVSFGPHPPGSPAIAQVQQYIVSQLNSYGCKVDTDDFHAPTPVGDLPMKNIIAKIPGTGRGIILLLTHYDTLRLDGFVGAEDAGSSSGLMLEMARLLCAEKPQANAVWIAFLDGEEAQIRWSDTDSVYGSRELAARMAVAGDLKRTRAVILADMIGQYNLQIPRESTSTSWLTNLVWKKAAELGYSSIFVDRGMAVEDDHGPFLHRNAPAVDIIDLDGYQEMGYWHTTQDTMDKISPASIAIVGHVIRESVNELQNQKR